MTLIKKISYLTDGGEEPNGKSLLQETVKNFVDQRLIPVLQISNVGHGAINNPIILASNSTLTMGNHYSLTF